MYKEKNNNLLPPPAFSDAIQNYFKTLEKKTYNTNTLELYKRAFVSFTKFITSRDIKRVQDVGIEDLTQYQTYIVKNGFAEATSFMYLRCIQSFYKYLEETRHVFANPAENLVIAEPKPKPHIVLTIDEVEKLFSMPNIDSNLGIRDRALVATVYETGVLAKDLCRMSIHDVDLNHGTMRIKGRGNKERVLPISARTLLWTKEYLKKSWPSFRRYINEDRLFMSRRSGKGITCNGVDKLFRNYGTSAGLKGKTTPYILRRSHAVHMLNKGVDPAAVQLHLGYTSLTHLSKDVNLTITHMKKNYKSINDANQAG